MERKKCYYKAFNFCIILVFIMSCMCTPVFAEDYKKVTKIEGLEETVDKYMEKSLKEYNIAGVTLVVVKDGGVVLKKGYGYSDVKKKISVNPDNTLFEIGSITKVFTATAAMQLVEQGKVDLNTDINEYLKDIKIENKYDKPITLANLLTNTGGFAEKVDGIFSEKLLDKPVPLYNTIKNKMPPLVRPSGEVVQYSNYGYALIGLIVEQVSGIPFDKYVEDNIFKPLNMNNTSYSLSSSILSKMSKGYVYENEKFIEKPLGSIIVHPAGSIVSTADDMAKFLITHLQNGNYEDKRILKEKTAISMHTRQFTQHDLMPGYTYGLYENFKNNKIIMHDGDVNLFISQLSLFPEENLGFFISYNTLDDGQLRDGFEEELYKFFKVKLDQKENNIKKQSSKLNKNLKGFEGDYVFAQRLLEGPLKIRGLFLKMNVSIDDNGTLNLKGFDTSLSGKYEQIEKNLFVNKENKRHLFLKQDKEGNKYLIMNMKVPMQTLEKLSVGEVFMETFVKYFFLIISILGCMMSFIQLFRKKKKKYVGATRRIKTISNTICLLNLFLAIGVMMVMFTQSDSFRQNVLIVVNLISIAIATSVVFISFSLISVWKKNVMPIWSRVFYIFVILAGIGALTYMYFLDVIFFV
ncbi:serine hydrolase domain-containing protein [Bacillus cereus]|uniref:Beta-lactamase-related domain-containing protein n=1 Tax=Bacillus cereus HuA2-1 TaxID=1053201 RepID=J9CP10_BACCE|nr:serine hydrolase domain-containing protein [Bacillus cereus]EJV87820.1 hypothetical protein IG3_01307 [Bacillus cereus HuA2-1]